jgi:membrane fusion protein, multidrug efflux system
MRTIALRTIMGVSCLVGAACVRKEAQQPPPPEVLVVPVAQRDVPVEGEWIGTLEGSVNADIRPRVEGYLLRQFYKEGQLVGRHDMLFEIDPRQFRAALEQTQGVLGQAEARLAKAAKDVERFTPLAAERAISQQELDDALSAERDARAAVTAAQAAVEQSFLNLGWTNVTSPIDGIVGLALFQVGALVGPQSVLTTVSTVDPIRVTFGISEREYLNRAELINRPNYATTERGPDLELVLEDGSVYPHAGKAARADRQVDVKTGTMTIWGFFPNPRHILRPGQFAKIKATLDVRKDALLVPQRAVSELQGGFRVAVVGAEGKAEFRSVELGTRVGELWVVEKGLKLGESVIVSGLQHVRPGMAVTAKPAPAADQRAGS